MSQQEKSTNSTKLFLMATIVLGVLIVFGLIWAIASDSDGSGKVVTFDITGSPKIGAENPELTVYLFSDFQCPACRVAEPGVQHAIDTYKDKVLFVWKDFPLQSLHANAFSAATAARCAEEQGKFWEYRDRLYDDQTRWSSLANPSAQYVSYADALGLDTEQFGTCYSERRFEEAVKTDIQQGSTQGINGTPTFYIGDKVFPKVMTPDEWDAAIQEALTSGS